MGISLFQHHWLQRPEFADWIRHDAKDIFHTYCHMRQQTFDVRKMGQGAMKSHGNGLEFYNC